MNDDETPDAPAAIDPAELAEFAEWKAQKATQSDEQARREQYETLRAEFEADPPAPQRPGALNNGAAFDSPWQDSRPRKETETVASTGWPI